MIQKHQFITDKQIIACFVTISALLARHYEMCRKDLPVTTAWLVHLDSQVTQAFTLISNNFKNITIADKMLTIPQQIVKAHSLLSVRCIRILQAKLLSGVFHIQFSHVVA